MKKFIALLSMVLGMAGPVLAHHGTRAILRERSDDAEGYRDGI